LSNFETLFVDEQAAEDVDESKRKRGRSAIEDALPPPSAKKPAAGETPLDSAAKARYLRT